MPTLRYLREMGTPELILIFLVLLPLILTIASLVQCLSSEFSEPTNKVIWVLVILFVPIFGPILWWVIGVNQRRLH
ncbi:MAG: PLD nuclease N-terminal domain-containing protein [Luteolibacter sp.]